MENISGNALVIKEININLVRKSLKIKGQATKQQIAADTGLSLVTVGTVLQYLLKQNEVFDCELSPSNGGRPAQIYRYNYDFKLALILFPYEAKGNIIIRSAIVSLSNLYIYEKDTQLESISLKSFEEIIEPLLIAYPNVQVIGIGHPGVEENGKIIGSDYKMLIGASFTEDFTKLYKLPVIVENDVNAAVIGFAKHRKAIEDCTLVYLYFPDKHPPGAGIFINGKLFKGRRNFAGEINNIPLNIVWNEALYSSPDLFCEATTKLIVTICSILNPDIVVLNGNFLCKAHIDSITQKCNDRLPQSIVPDIFLSDNYVSDYQSGLAVQTLELLEPNIKLTRKKHPEVK